MLCRQHRNVLAVLRGRDRAGAADERRLGNTYNYADCDFNLRGGRLVRDRDARFSE
jgi:hypothetical protein